MFRPCRSGFFFFPSLFLYSEESRCYYALLFILLIYSPAHRTLSCCCLRLELNDLHRTSGELSPNSRETVIWWYLWLPFVIWTKLQNSYMNERMEWNECKISWCLWRKKKEKRKYKAFKLHFLSGCCCAIHQWKLPEPNPFLKCPAVRLHLACAKHASVTSGELARSFYGEWVRGQWGESNKSSSVKSWLYSTWLKTSGWTKVESVG